MTAQPCPGNCNSRWRKALAAYQSAIAAYNPLDPSTSRPEPPDESLIREWGAPVWCGEHTTLITLHLSQLGDLAAIYAQADDGHRTAPVTQRVGGATVVQSPSEIHDTLGELTGALAGWEQSYRTLMGWPAPPPRGDDATVQETTIAWLAYNLRGILASELAEEIGRGILTWRPAIANPAKAGARTILLEARCPGRGCGQRLLTWVEGTDRVECGNIDCGQILSKQQYDTEAGRQAQAHRELYHRGGECNCVLRRASLLASGH
jgi:hypothetical protein